MCNLLNFKYHKLVLYFVRFYILTCLVCVLFLSYLRQGLLRIYNLNSAFEISFGSTSMKGN